MGVPKLFRWLTDRYPLIAQAGLGVTLRSSGILPPIDDLFIDANSIIHSCTHPEYGTAPKTEAEMFKRIGIELDTMVSIVAPRRTFFVAVDGVAPRAKLNQQRSRRFRSALASQSSPADNDFDPNAITPGTPFMVRLSAFLRSFLQSKSATETIYPPKVIYSGQEIPGEGEHKILDEIRSLSKRNALGATCIHGLDADLIMLALASQHRYFVLLREQRPMSWERKRRDPATLPQRLGEMKFDVLHISILRDYLTMELGDGKDEGVISDFVLLAMLAGNDFLPHVPGCHIDKHSLDVLLATYVKVRKASEFLTSPSTSTAPINWALLARILEASGLLEVATTVQAIPDMSSSPQSEILRTVEDSLTDAGTKEPNENGSEAEKIDYTTYYARKFSLTTGGGMEPIVAAYVRTLLWTFHYYYHGLVSWTFFYPYHYAPLAIDIYRFLKEHSNRPDIIFELGIPLRPLEQLLAVLPAASARRLLPPVLYELMLAEGPLSIWYPSTFPIDFNEKKQDWEAIVLIPFIDEVVLLEAVHQAECRLTPTERKLNEIRNAPFIWNMPAKLRRTRQQFFSWMLGLDVWWPSLSSLSQSKRGQWVKGRRNALSLSLQIELGERQCVECLLPDLNTNALFANWPYCPLLLGTSSFYSHQNPPIYLRCLGVTNGDEIICIEKGTALQRRQMTKGEKDIFSNSLAALRLAREVALLLPAEGWYFYGRTQGSVPFLTINGVKLKSGRDFFLIPPSLLLDLGHNKKVCVHQHSKLPPLKTITKKTKNKENVFTTSPFAYFVKEEACIKAIDATQLEAELLGLDSTETIASVDVIAERLRKDLGIVSRK